MNKKVLSAVTVLSTSLLMTWNVYASSNPIDLKLNLKEGQKTYIQTTRSSQLYFGEDNDPNRLREVQREKTVEIMEIECLDVDESGTMKLRQTLKAFARKESQDDGSYPPIHIDYDSRKNNTPSNSKIPDKLQRRIQCLDKSITFRITPEGDVSEIEGWQPFCAADFYWMSKDEQEAKKDDYLKMLKSALHIGFYCKSKHPEKLVPKSGRRDAQSSADYEARSFWRVDKIEEGLMWISSASVAIENRDASKIRNSDIAQKRKQSETRQYPMSGITEAVVDIKTGIIKKLNFSGVNEDYDCPGVYKCYFSQLESLELENY